MLSNERKQQLAVMNLPSEEEMRRRTRLFMMRSGLTPVEMAEAVGYAYSSLNLFLSGSYDANHPREANSLNIRASLKQYMDLHEIESGVILRGAHHRTSDYVSVRRSALNALERGTAYLVDGPPGTQKTWILRQVEREINLRRDARAVYVYTRAEHSPLSFLIEACICAGIPHRGKIDQLLRKLRYFLGDGRTLLMVDEAQHLGLSGLEVLRQLLDLPPYFGVILAGSHDLSQRLSHWQMEQWRSRLRKKHFLNGLTTEEAESILVAELGKLPRSAIHQTIADSRSEASRDGKKFTYISARNLFDAIEAAKLSLCSASHQTEKAVGA
jgi:DNA transposition AAA+ family ATPase